MNSLKLHDTQRGNPAATACRSMQVDTPYLLFT